MELTSPIEEAFFAACTKTEKFVRLTLSSTLTIKNESLLKEQFHADMKKKDDKLEQMKENIKSLE